MRHLIILSILILSGCIKTNNEIKSGFKDHLTPPSWTTEDQNFSKFTKTGYWLETFNNHSLEQVVRIAWNKNPSLLAMAEHSLVRGEEAVIAGAEIVPSVNLGVNGSRSKRNLIGFNFPNGSTSFTSQSFNSGFNLSWEIDLWGKIRNRKESAKKRFAEAQADFEGARLSLAGRVSKAWYGIVESNQQLKLSAQMTETFKKNQNFIANRFANGLASSLENNLATTALASSQASETKLQRRRDNLVRELEAIIDEYPDGSLDLNFSNSLPFLDLTPMPPTPAKVLENRHDLKAARHQLEATGHDLSVARSSLLPTFSLSGISGSRSEEFGKLLDNRFRTWEVTGSVTQPIFNAGRLRANIRRTKAIRQAARANYHAIALRALTEVESLLANEYFLSTEESYLSIATETAQAAAQSSWDRYRRGVQEIFETLDSQRQAFEAESKLLAMRKERIFNRVQLFLALGNPALPDKP